MLKSTCLKSMVCQVGKWNFLVFLWIYPIKINCECECIKTIRMEKRFQENKCMKQDKIENKQAKKK
jgi:hypothetical protein